LRVKGECALQDNIDLQELQGEKRVRVSAMSAGIVVAVLAICFVVLTAMWYDGKFSNQLSVATAPSNPSVGDSTTAPTPPAGTVGQAPAPAQGSK
jgi:hypothetical protein